MQDPLDGPLGRTPQEPATGRRALAAAAVALVGYAALCKALLFRDLEYTGSDLYSCLEMSRSWFFAGRLLHDNAYGNVGAIHNFYLLLAFSPLTLRLGAYGLFAGLVALEALAVARVSLSGALELPGRAAVLAGLVSPLAFYVFDDRVWGFHPELCYPPLAVLFALALVEGRRGPAILAAAAIVLVKEDGALVCAGVLAAYFARGLWAARGGPPAERRAVALRAAASLAAAGLAFAAGLALLWWAGLASPAEQTTASERLGRAVGILVRTLGPAAPASRRAALRELLAGYAVLCVLLLLPLAARIGSGLALLLVSAGPLVTTLVVSDAQYKFATLLWAPRAATLMALAVACVAVTGAGPPARRAGWSIAWVTAFALLSWALQLLVLARLDYPLGERIDARALWTGRGYAVSGLPAGELRFWRCLGERLPAGLAVSPVAELYPFFHRQTIVFQGLEQHALQPARLRVTRGSTQVAASADGALCAGPVVGALRLEAACDLLPDLEACGWR